MSESRCCSASSPAPAPTSWPARVAVPSPANPQLCALFARFNAHNCGFAEVWRGVSEHGHDLARDDAARPGRTDRAGLRSIAGEEYARVGPGCPGAHGHAARLLAQPERGQMAKLRAETGGPDDGIRRGESAVGPAHAL